MEIVLVWLLLAVGVGALASSRGRSVFGFFLLSVVLSPLLGLIVLLLMSDLNKEREAKEQQQRDEAEKDRVRREEHERQLESIKVLATSRQEPTVAAPTSKLAPGASLADEIRKLAQLRDDGLLTPEEFAEQKARLLGAAPAPLAAAAAAPPVATAGKALSTEFGVCPSCNSTIELQSEKCPRCSALFGPDSSWAVKKINTAS